MLKSQDKIIEQLESEIKRMKLQQITNNDDCMEMVKNLMDEIRGLKKNLSVLGLNRKSCLGPSFGQSFGDKGYLGCCYGVTFHKSLL